MHLRKQSQLSPLPIAETAAATSSFVSKTPSSCKRAPSGIRIRQPRPTSSTNVSLAHDSTANAMALASSPSTSSQSSPSTMRSKARRNCSNLCQSSSSLRNPGEAAKRGRANRNRSRQIRRATLASAFGFGLTCLAAHPQGPPGFRPLAPSASGRCPLQPWVN